MPGSKGEIKLKIVILDSIPTNVGDLDWSPLASHGELLVHDSTSANQTVERCSGAQIVLTNKVVMSREIIAALPELKMIQVLATGYNVVDTQAARELGIAVSNVPAYSTPSVAQHTISLLLALTNRVELHASSVSEGEWDSIWSYWLTPMDELAGKVFGIIGLGGIGAAVAKIADALGMKVIFASRSQKQSEYEQVSIDEVFTRSDVISLHSPLTPETNGLVSRKRLALMKPTALLINTSRGPLVDEQALADALNSAQIAGAALDVLSQEPPSAANPLLKARNCLITPHVAWSSLAARRRMAEVIFSNVDGFVSGHPKNVVN